MVKSLWLVSGKGTFVFFPFLLVVIAEKKTVLVMAVPNS